MTTFDFLENGYCTNPVTLRTCITPAVKIVLSGCEYNGLWDCAWDVMTKNSGSGRGAYLENCKLPQSAAIAEAAGHVLEILKHAQGFEEDIPAYVFDQVRSWKQGQQLSLF